MAVALAVSLSDLRKYLQMSEQQLDNCVSDAHLLTMSGFLTVRERLAQSLGLSDADVEAIERDGKGEEDKRLRTLQRWKEKNAFKATYRKIVEALLSLGMASRAVMVCRLLQPEPSGSGCCQYQPVEVACHNETFQKQSKQLQVIPAELPSQTHSCEIPMRCSDPVKKQSFREENEALKRENQELQAEISSLRAKIVAMSSFEDRARSEIESLRAENERMRSEIFSEMTSVRDRSEIESSRADALRLSVHQRAASSEIHHARLQWRRGADVPEGISGTQIVAMGELVYVSAIYKVFLYNWRRDTWSTLPDHPQKWSGMAPFQGKLVTVGGCNGPLSPSGKVYQLNAQQWIEFLPPMPTARSAPTVVTRTNRSPAIVACGGADAHYKPVTTVEVYSLAASQWYTATSLPIRWYGMTSATIDNTCYVLGGTTIDNKYVITATKRCFSVSLDSLIDSATSPCSQSDIDDPMWMSVSDTPLVFPTAASLRGFLVAIGGQDDRTCTNSSAIHILTSDGFWERWRGGDLPEPCCSSTALCLPSGELMIAGGYNCGRKKTVFIARSEYI